MRGAIRFIGSAIVAFFALTLTACLAVSPEYFKPIPDEENYAPEFKVPDIDPPVYDPPAPQPEQVPDTQPGGGISWSDTVSYFGSHQRVCGPFAGWGASDNDVFLNLGHDYPSLGRFQIELYDPTRVELDWSHETQVTFARSLTSQAIALWHASGPENRPPAHFVGASPAPGTPPLARQETLANRGLESCTSLTTQRCSQ